MIQLDPATIAAHPLMSQLKNPPTHALAVFKRYAHIPLGVKLPKEYQITIGGNTIEAIYAYGTLDSNGNFVADQIVDAVHAMVDLTGYSSPQSSLGADSARKYEAAKNLMLGGMAPTPGAPYTAITVPNKPHDFKEKDLDALIAFWDELLIGTVVPSPDSLDIGMTAGNAMIPSSLPSPISAVQNPLPSKNSS